MGNDNKTKLGYDAHGSGVVLEGCCVVAGVKEEALSVMLNERGKAPSPW